MILFVAFVGLLVAAIVNSDDPFHPQFHPGPATHWMNDPNGPMYYQGNYHLFFQYNPTGPNWGDMSWGHIISKDLAHWHHLPVALSPDMAYDKRGVFTGSTTILDDGTPVIVYTCVNSGQQQCVAYPANKSDPFLTNWTKPDYNPVIKDPPPGGVAGSFRDDTTAWKSGGSWKLVVGASINGHGAASLWDSKDFKTWTYVHPLYTTTQYGMWECPDFYPLHDSKNTYALKYSAGGRDWYTLGSYDESKQVLVPSGNATLFDYGHVYASKRFYDPVKKRQIFYGWVSEEDKGGSQRGWQGIQTLPRSLTLDSDLAIVLSTPVDELASLRKTGTSMKNVQLAAGQTMPLKGVSGLQLEIEANFTFDKAAASQRFGISVRMSLDGSMRTDILFVHQNMTGPMNNTDLPGDEYRQFPYKVGNTEEANIALCKETCDNETKCVAWTYVRKGDPVVPRCSLKNGIPHLNPNKFCVSGIKRTNMFMVDRSKTGGDGNQGSVQAPLPMKSGEETVTIRAFVDHSIIESYAQGGRAVITSRVYPDASADGVALVNYGSQPINAASVQVWPMNNCWV
ncbi:uncharacterized protein [Oscarella lobularis]|uniref:uncharacterized protein isoform X2 n=1 Tax=Oscarella lobularis TaxID=121494 RepID=UPI0033136B19